MKVTVLGEDLRKFGEIDEFQSLIWVERYRKEGEVTLIVDNSVYDYRHLLTRGTLLTEEGSDELMEVKTVSVKDGILTAKGVGILKIFDDRLVRANGDVTTKVWNVTTETPAKMIEYVVNQMVVDGPYIQTIGLNIIDGPRQKIPNLSVINSDPTGTSTNVAVPYGSLYDAVVDMANTFGLGIKLYRGLVTPTTVPLFFEVYRGKDRSRAQTTNEVVEFSPALDNLSNAESLISSDGYKNIVYAFCTSITAPAINANMGVAYAQSDSATSMGFNRRTLMIFVDDVTTDVLGGGTTSQQGAALTKILSQRARDALAQHNYINLVTGDVVPQSSVKFGTHYFLGDIVSLQGNQYMDPSRARITEYTRIQDGTGYHENPTVEVV